MGPNGSGKSNVIDAMLFVFGKRAKKLRLNKVSELIHRSEQFPDLDRARVSVHMADVVDASEDDSYDVVAGSEVIVTRTAFGNNSSKYSVDGSPRTFAQVAELLRERGIDLDNNRFLILQGEVEQIAMMKPKGTSTTMTTTTSSSSSNKETGDAASGNNNKQTTTQHHSGEDGLLEYLEDIIGSNSYVENIEKASEVVEEKAEARGEKLNRLKVTENELSSLDGPKREAEAFVVKDNEVRRARSELYQTYAFETGKVASEVESKRAEAQQSLDALSDRKKEVNDLVRSAETDFDEAKKVLNEADKVLKKKREAHAAAEAAEIELREEVKHRQAAMRKLKATLSQAETDIAAFDKTISEADTKSTEAASTLAEKTEEKTNADAIFQKARDDNATTTKVAREAVAKAQREKLAPAKEALTKAKAEMDTLFSEVDDARTAANAALNAVNAAASKLATATELRASKEQALDQATATLQEKQRRKVDIEARLVDDSHNCGDVVESEKAARARAREASKAVEAVKAQVQRKETASKTTGAVRAILVESRSESASSPLAKARVRGRLGDLGSVDKKFDIAVSTATDMFDYVVVDTAACAQTCIAFLRAKNLGRASFVALSELDQWRRKLGASSPPKQPSSEKKKNVRLFDLVSCDHEDFKAAFYLALRETLVAPNLDAAVELAYRGRTRNRVVTLEGHLLDTAGTMTGGGGKPKSGKMRLADAGGTTGSARKKDATRHQKDDDQDDDDDDDGRVLPTESLATLEERAKKANEDLAAAASKRARLEAELRSLTTEVDALGAKLPRLRADLEAATAACARFEQRLEELRTDAKLKKSVADEKDREAGPDREKRREALEGLEDDAKSAEAEVERLRKAVLDAGGADLKAATKRADAAQKALTAAEAAVAEVQRTLKSATRALAKSRAAKAKAQKDLEDLETAANSTGAATEDAIAKAALVATEAKADLDAADHVCDQHKKKLHEAHRALEDLQKEASDLKNKQVDLQHQLDDFARALKDNRAKVQHWTKEIAKLRTHHAAQIRAYGDVLKDYYAAANDDEDDAMEDDDDEENEQQPAPRGAFDNNDDDDVDMEDDEKDNDNDDDAAAETKEGEEGQKKTKRKRRQRGEASDPCVLEDVAEAELEKKDKEEVKYRLAILEGERDALKKEVNLQTIEEYRSKKLEYQSRLDELEAVTDERNKARDRLEDLKRRRLDDFMIGFGAIALKLKEMYQMITLGGDAELELVDSLDPFSEGVVFSVRPPKKSWKHIANLSGGEKTLSSLALVFALHHYKPTPLYVMDEIDAALDFKNVSIIANYISTRCKTAQFIIISLRNQMFELADRLVGIYKTHNVTKTITIAPDHFAKKTFLLDEENNNNNGEQQTDDHHPHSSSSSSSAVLRDATNNVD